MKLRVIVDRLDLTKEKETKVYNDIIDVPRERAEEILNYRFDNQKVVEPIYEIDDEIINKSEELKNKVKELEEENTNLILKNEELKNKVKELEEENTKIIQEIEDKTETENAEESDSNIQSKKRKEDK